MLGGEEVNKRKVEWEGGGENEEVGEREEEWERGKGRGRQQRKESDARERKKGAL